MYLDHVTLLDTKTSFSCPALGLMQRQRPLSLSYARHLSHQILQAGLRLPHVILLDGCADRKVTGCTPKHLNDINYLANVPDAANGIGRNAVQGSQAA